MKSFFLISLLAFATCKNKDSSKSYDKNGVLYSEAIDSTHWKSYSYYKNKSIYKIAYLVNHFTNGKIDFIHEDSSIVFAMNGKKLLFSKQYKNDEDQSEIKIFMPDGSQKDSVVNNFVAEEAERYLIGKDTIQLEYEFNIDQKKE